MATSTPHPRADKDSVQAGPISLGIDIGGTKIEGVAIDGDEHLLACRRTPTRQGNQAVHDDTVTLIRHLLDQVGPNQGPVTVGLGIPGRVDANRGMVDDAVNLGIRHMALGPAVAKTTGLPVRVENDVNVAALGAASQAGDTLMAPGTTPHSQAAKDQARHPASEPGRDEPRALPDQDDHIVAFINLGTGLAAGVIRGGRIEHGASGAIGEIGHISVDAHQFPCKCGQRGCLETVASGSAVEALWPGIAHPLPDLIAQASQGNQRAQRVEDIIGHGIALAVQIVALTIDPAIIILGGGMSKTGQPLLDLVTEHLNRSAACSHFIASLNLPDRLRLATADLPIAAIGAALAGRMAADSRPSELIGKEIAS